MKVQCPKCDTLLELKTLGNPARMACPSCGSSIQVLGMEETLPRASEPGAMGHPGMPRIGHFDLVEKVGGGAFGVVWKARDTELDRIVAVKIPRAGLLAPEDSEKFLREARSAAQLRHPNIVSVHEVGRERGVVFIVSDFVEGTTLADRLASQPLAVREAVELCAKIADALHYAHQAGVIHRDLKPGNILLDSDGEPHIVDFGLARREAGEVTVTLEGHILGTPAYMSPEQARGASHTADRRSDVYSLGVILYELLTGMRPFRGNIRMLVHQVIHNEPPSPRRFKRNLSRDLETVCLKCLEKAPSRRYATAAGLAVDLKRYLRGEPVLARPVGKAERAVRWARRNPVVATLLAAVAATLIGGAAISTYFGLSASHQARQAKRDRQLAEHKGKQAEQTTQQAKVAQEESKKAKAVAALAQQDEARRRAMEYLEEGRSLCEQQRTAHGLLWMVRALEALPSDDDPCQHAIRANLSFWHQRLFTRKLLPDQLSSSSQSFALSPDGTRLAIGGAGRVRFFDPRTLQPVAEELELQQNVFFLSFSPDGQRLLTLESPVMAGRGRFIVGASADYVGDPKQTSQARIWSLPDRTAIGEPLPCTGYVLSSVGYDGERVCLGVQGQPAITVWDVGAGVQIGKVDAPRWGASLSPDGKHIAVPDLGSIRIWSLEERKSIVSFKVDDWPERLQYSPDGAWIAALSAGGTPVIVLNAVSGVEVCRIAMPQNAISFRFTPDSKTLVTVNESTIHFWEARTGRQIGEVLPNHTQGKILAVAREYQYLVSEDSGGISLWSRPSDADMEEIHESDFTFSTDHGGSGRWNQSGKKIEPPKWRPGQPTILPPSDGFVPSCDPQIGVRIQGGRAQIWNTVAKRPLSEFLPMEKVKLATFSANGKWLATADAAGTARVWRVPSGEPFGKEWRTRTDLWFGLRPDDKPNLGKVADGRPVGIQADPFTSLFLHPEGRLLVGRTVSGGWSGSTRIFSVLSGKVLDRTIEHESNISGIVFSPDGRLIATGSWDKTARLWDAETGIQIGATHRFEQQVRRIGFSEDGRSLMTQESIQVRGKGYRTHRLAVPSAVASPPALIRLALEVETGLTIGEAGTVSRQSMAEWQQRNGALNRLPTPVFPPHKREASAQDATRTPEQRDARRQNYLKKYLPALAESAKHDVSADTYAQHFPPHVDTQVALSTQGMNARLFFDAECSQPRSPEQLAGGPKVYFKGHFDDRGLLRQVECYGTDGSIKGGIQGCPLVRYWYNEQGNRIQEAYCDPGGRLIKNRMFFAVAHHAYENRRLLETRYFNHNTEPDEDYLGVHRRVFVRSEPLEYRLDGTRRIPWLPPVTLGTRLRGKAAWGPCLSFDGKELYYSMGWTGMHKTNPHGIHRVRWEDGRWSDPELVLADGKPLVGVRPFISSDNRFLTFTAWKSDSIDGRTEYPLLPNFGSSDIYVTEWSGTGWQAVRNAGEAINHGSQISASFVPGTHDLMITGRPDSERKDVRAHSYLVRSTLVNGAWSDPTPVSLADAESLGIEPSRPSFTRDGTRMYFSGTGGSGYGGGDLWWSSREQEGWSRPINLGPPVNTSADEGASTLSPEGDVLYFDAVETYRGTAYRIQVTGRADSEAAIRHLADIYADSDHNVPP